MRKLIIGLALTAAVATPALANTWRAESTQVRYHTGALAYAAEPTPVAFGYDAYAAAPVEVDIYGQPLMYGPSTMRQGTDPDPFIRQQLQREPSHGGTE